MLLVWSVRLKRHNYGQQEIRIILGVSQHSKDVPLSQVLVKGVWFGHCDH